MRDTAGGRDWRGRLACRGSDSGDDTCGHTGTQAGSTCCAFDPSAGTGGRAIADAAGHLADELVGTWGGCSGGGSGSWACNCAIQAGQTGDKGADAGDSVDAI